MGQAKLRGSRDERVLLANEYREATERAYARMRAANARQRPVSKQARAAMSFAALAMVLGSGYGVGYRMNAR